MNMERPTLSKRLASWGRGIELHDVPRQVKTIARSAILDTLGVIGAGGAHPMVRALASGLPEVAGPCSIVGRRDGSAEIAALINGTAAHAWDFDDTSYTGIMHGSAVIVPVALALAEESKTTEDKFIAAFIAGSEVSYTLADICTHNHYFKGWWSTTTFGLIGATVTAAHLLELTADQTTQAVSLAVASASGGKVVFGTDGKAFLVGETAKRAIGFACAAKAGLTGPPDAFENPRGFFALLNDGIANLTEADSLGHRWRLMEPGLLFKTSPVCSAAHAAIEQIVLLMNDACATPDDIISIKAEVPKLVDISLVYPCPKTIQQAQFSLPYALACAVFHGHVRLEDLNPVEITSIRKVALMDKVTTVVADDLSTNEMRLKFPESARLKVTLADGRVVSGFCGEAYGMPGRPLSDKDLVDKFFGCLRFAGSPIPNRSVQSENLLHIASKILQCETQTTNLNPKLS